MNMKKGMCPVCDAEVSLGSDVEATEVVSCVECKTKLVVESVNGETANLTEAPAVEEDWGE